LFFDQYRNDSGQHEHDAEDANNCGTEWQVLIELNHQAGGTADQGQHHTSW